MDGGQQRRTRREKQQNLDATPDTIAKSKALRSQSMAVLRSGESKGEKKRKLTKIMDDIKFDPGFVRDVQKSEPHRCRRESEDPLHPPVHQVKARQLRRNVGRRRIVASRTCGKDQGHLLGGGPELGSCLVRHGRHRTVKPGQISNVAYEFWDDSAVVIDGWTSDYYPVKHPYNPIEVIAFNSS